MNKLRFLVCPHDAAGNPERWYLFAQLLSRETDNQLTYEPCLDFREFHEKLSLADIVYANPQDSLKLFKNDSYIPLVRPADVYDEVVIISNSALGEKSLEDISGHAIASVTSMMPTYLAVEYINSMSVYPADVENRDSWMSVVKAVYQGDVDFGFLYKDFHDGLNSLTRSTYNVIDVTNEERIHHMFMLNPRHRDQVDSITEVLLSLHERSGAVEVMNELNMKQFLPVESTTMELLEALSGALEKLRDIPIEGTPD
ncbi:MAG: PhnD/SsuA/transferrin family substrate-binding protein [Granulosicoccus sp.]